VSVHAVSMLSKSSKSVAGVLLKQRSLADVARVLGHGDEVRDVGRAARGLEEAAGVGRAVSRIDDEADVVRVASHADDEADVARVAGRGDGVGGAGRGEGGAVSDAPVVCPWVPPVGGHSFSGGSEVVLVGGGLRRIDEVVVGDVVWSVDPVSGVGDGRRVLWVWEHVDGGLVDVTVVDDVGNRAVVHSTAGHRLWVGSRSGWSRADGLRAGEWLWGADGSRVTVARVARVAGRARMFDLSVEGFHTYFVDPGATPAVLVHNTNAPKTCGGSGAATSDAISAPLWTSTSNKTSAENAFGHFKSHGEEFDDIGNASEYAAKAQDFLTTPPGGTKVRPNGDVVRYHPGSNTFGVANSNGVPRTLFRPNTAEHGLPTNLDYFYAQ
jgi:hypothetical protein